MADVNVRCTSFSTYYQTLEDTSKQRYREKVQKLGGLKDPYLLLEQGVAGDTWQNWPEVEYPDLFCYLIETTSEYTGESLKLIKVLNHTIFF